MSYREVTLTNAEMLSAAIVGTTRHIAALKRGLEDQYGCDPNSGWQVHVEGACGEQAFCKVYGLFWNCGINTFGDADVSTQIQVRTRSEHWHDLIVRDNANDDDYFVLVTGRAPNYRVHGGIFARMAKLRDDWRQTHGGRTPAFFVPQADLQPIPAVLLMVARRLR